MRRQAPMAWVRLALASVLLALIVVVPLHAQDGGIIEGQVVNGTPSGPVAGAGLPVTLHIVRSGSEVDNRETTTDADGRFRFEGLDPDTAVEYWPDVSYQDALYTSADAVKFEGEAKAVEATVEVYESSDDDSALRLDSVHVIAESFGQVVRISEIHMFSNGGDTTFAGNGEGPTPETTVFVPLPVDAVGLAFNEDDPAGRYVEAENGVWDTEPVTPGENTAIVYLSYHVMVTGETLVLEREFDYPVSAFNILVTQPGLSLTSERLIDQGLQSFQGRDYGFYVAENLPAGEKLVLNFVVDQTAAASSPMPGAAESSAPATTTATTTAAVGQQGMLRIAGFVLAGLAVVAAVAYPRMARQPAAGGPAPTGGSAARLSPEQQLLIEELAGLEEAREDGALDEVAYEERRAAIYDRLRSS